MIGKKINQLATELAPASTDLTIIGDPISGVSKKITIAQLGAIFSGAVSFYDNFAAFPATGDINVIYCAKDTKKLYLWSGSAYVEVFPSQALLDTYQLRSEKGNANGYASLDSGGKVPISQLPSSIMEYKGTWNAATNTPTLANGTGDTGDVYICNVAGTVNFGAGPLTFAVGDYVIYSGSIWQRSSGAVGTVTSVAVSRSGDALAITGSPITTSGTINIGFAGNSTQYVNGAGNLVTFPGIINEAQNLITEVYNKTGATLTKGTVVYINGGQGNLPSVTKALATGDATSAQTYGIVRNNITNNNNGYVVVAGRISDLDTQAYTEGTQLYLSPTTAGTFTSTKPYAPNHLVYVGIVVRAHPTQGVIEVKIQNGYEMDELHNVAAQSPDNNDILQYKTATSLWTKVAGTTSNIAEGSNLYYTDARSRAAISLTTTGTSGAATYNSTTGVLNVPQYADQFVGTVTSVAALTIGTSGTDLSSTVANSTTTPVITLNVPTASATNRGALSSADWTTFNNKQNTLTNPVTGTGTTNYIAKFTGTSTIGNSLVFDNGTNVGIGTNSPTFLLDVNGTLRASANVTGTDNVAVFHNTNTTTGGTPVIALSTASTGIDAPADIRLSGTNTKGIRIYAADSTLTSTPLGAGFQMFSVSSTTYPGQMFFDSGANNSAFISFRTAVTSGTITERMRITAAGNVGIGTTSPDYPLTVQANSGAAQAIKLLGRSVDNISILSFHNNANSTQYGYIAGIPSEFRINSGSSVPITFTNLDTERMRISSGGNVGIGTTSPGNFSGVGFAAPIFDVAGIIQIKGTATNTIAALQFGGDTFRKALIYTSVGTDTPYMAFGVAASGSSSSANEAMRITSGGQVQVKGGTASFTSSLAVTNATSQPAGVDIGFTAVAPNNTTNAFLYCYDSSVGCYTIWSNGTTSGRSDEKLKKNISDATSKLDDIMKLRVVNYEWKDSIYGIKEIGLIAQEVENIFPNLVVDGKENEDGVGYKQVKYSVLPIMLLKAIQELKAELDTLKNK